MNVSKIFITLLVTLVFSFSVTATATMATAVNAVTPAAVKKVEGGPRTVIQAMTDVVVYQPTSTNLYTTIVNSEGNSVIETETREANTVISLEGLPSGNYTLETIDDNGDYQEFSITVE